MKTIQKIQTLLFATLISVSTHLSAQPGSFTLAHTISDGAQGNTIAFDGMAFLTGNFCACSFIPPGKVADYFGFQYARDNDLTSMGHNTDFLTVLANNMLYVLDTNQRRQLINTAKTQVPLINQYGYERFPLIKAFVRLRDNDLPAGSTGLSKSAIENYSAQLYRLDARISLDRARLYATVIRGLSPAQKHYLDSIKVLGMAHMPVLPDVIDKRTLTHDEMVAVMSFAGDIYTWYIGDVDADVYFCPERQGNYFGGFYIKDAPAVGNSGYSIDTSLTQTGGIRFVAALNPAQASLITSLTDSQRTALYALVEKRTAISTELRKYIAGETVDTSLVYSLSEAYGALDGEISYYYATNFSAVNRSLTAAQRDTLLKLRNLDKYPCNGAYLYSDAIAMPTIANTDTLFDLQTTGTVTLPATRYALAVYPNPVISTSVVYFKLAESATVRLQLFNSGGQLIRNILNETMSAGTHQVNLTGLASNAVYYCRLITASGSESVKIYSAR